MPLNYKVIAIYTSEDVRWNGKLTLRCNHGLYQGLNQVAGVCVTLDSCSGGRKR